MEFLESLGMLPFFNTIDVFLLIMVRLVGFFMMLPVLSGSNLPGMARLLLSLGITLIIFSAEQVTDVFYYNNVPGYVMLLTKEFLVGFILAFGAYMAFTVFYFAGQLIDYQIGFSMVSILDPLTQIQVPVIGNLLYLMVSVIFVITGGIEVFITAIYNSYDVIQPGQAFFIGNSRLFLYVLHTFTEYLSLGFQIALPIVGSIVIVDVALGLLVKAVPQMNVFVVGIPMKLLIGLAVFYMLLPVFSEMAGPVFELSYIALRNVLGGMTP